MNAPDMTLHKINIIIIMLFICSQREVIRSVFPHEFCHFTNLEHWSIAALNDTYSLDIYCIFSVILKYLIKIIHGTLTPWASANWLNI